MFTCPEVAPKMGKMVGRMWVGSLLHYVGPLVIGNWHICEGTPKHFAEGLDYLLHRESLAHHWICPLRRLTIAAQEGRGDPGNIFATGKRKSCVAIAPGQEDCVLFSDGAADQCAYVLVIRWSLNMNCSDLCPIENSIGQTVLQVSTGRGTYKLPENGVVWCIVELRIVNNQI